jgi:uncharacterized membrane protein
MSMSDKKKRFAADGRFYRGGMRWMGGGFEFLIVIGACVWGGYWMDKLEDTSPGWMILGFFIGFAIMLYVLIQRARKDAAEEQAEKESEWEAELKTEAEQRESNKSSNG